MTTTVNRSMVTLRPGARTAVRAILFMTCLISGCASTSFKAYEGPDLPDHEAVFLDWSACGVCSIRIDGVAIPPQKARVPIKKAWLKPGTHVIEIVRSAGYTGEFYIRKSVTYENSATILMQAGHRYAVIDERERGWGMGNFRDYLWIENATTGEIVAGSPPPHQRKTLERSSRARDERVNHEHFQSLSAYAHCGDPLTQGELALYYLAGLEPVSRRDLVHAYLLYSLAARAGDSAAATVRGRIAADMSSEQLIEAKRRIDEIKAASCPVEADAGVRENPARADRSDVHR